MIKLSQDPEHVYYCVFSFITDMHVHKTCVIIISCLQYLYSNAGTSLVHKSLLFRFLKAGAYIEWFPSHSYSMKWAFLIWVPSSRLELQYVSALNCY